MPLEVDLQRLISKERQLLQVVFLVMTEIREREMVLAVVLVVLVRELEMLGLFLLEELL